MAGLQCQKAADAAVAEVTTAQQALSMVALRNSVMLVLSGALSVEESVDTLTMALLGAYTHGVSLRAEASVFVEAVEISRQQANGR